MRIAIYGYGNLGKGVEAAVAHNSDTELVGVFTRRNPESVKTVTGTPTYNSSDILNFKDKIDVLIICGGSATDLPVMTPDLAGSFNVIDSFDTHAKIPEHFENVNEKALSAGKTALISCGWDPGMFSLNRIYADAILPNGKTYTFWGKGVSQGHSDAIRRINGVLDARQYTIPVEEALEKVRNGKTEDFTARQMHKRDCYVAVEDGADKARIEKEIKEMPNYFADYDTTVNFISMEELKANHSGIPHGGVVIRSGKTGLDCEFNNTVEYKLSLDSNPAFTSSVLVAYARAIYRLNQKGDFGCKTVFDIPPALLSPLSGEELRKKLL